MKSIKVAATHPYQAWIGTGLLDRVGEMTAALRSPCPVALVMDETVAELYGELVASSFAKAGFRPHMYRFPPGEGSKSFELLSHLLEFLAQKGLGRGDLVAALGGGVTGDLAGFAASVYQRGTAYIQIPTTLLAAVDSSVGGKTAVNLPSGKNLAGTFWQPEAVFCDCATFATLPRQELASGAAECVKYGMLGVSGLLETLTRDGLAASWMDIVPPCVAYKAEIVRVDERENGLRRMLNLGHTLGHGVEKLSGFTVRHGEGVAVGMAILTRAAERMGFCEAGTFRFLQRALDALGLPSTSPFSAEALADASLGDKKRQGDHITLILPRNVGSCGLYPISITELLPIIRLGMEEGS
ncbi:MAG: 3-dehydroquinate synthase [Clostridiales bacterium]|nr:3-dehydroquinate synthase [Clostridiales bacterium]